ncbi:MAG: SLBB domain-containing protein [Candidatus Marinimicrobia bacterium]|nr:SLBB domain-containing protein [Candidatus Neomarinimicrobiota bacterium]
MRKITIHVALILFAGVALAQSQQDIERYKKQYEQLLQDRSSNQVIGVENISESIDGDIPTEFIMAEKKDVEKTEKTLKYFGYNFFTMRDSIPIWDNLPLPSSYRLGPGDEIIISLWGETQLRSSYFIGRDGMVYIERVGQLNLTGKSMEQAGSYLEKQFQKVYETLKGSNPSTFLDVSLGKLKSINVTFVGEVKLPGIHPLHPFSTVLTGLIQAGGVDTTGSLRNIQIIRGDNDPQQVDLYAFLSAGKTAAANTRLQDNDVIFIPTRNSSIEIEGAVKRPGIYESIPGETVADLVDYAGGLKINAQHNLAVYRFNPASSSLEQNAKSVIYVPFNEAHQVTIQGNEQIIVYAVPDYTKSVYVFGQVKNPGEYGFEEGMHLLDLMHLVGGLFDDTYYQTIYAEKADILRRNSKSNFPEIISVNLADLIQGNQTQNIELQNWDVVLVRQNQNFTISKQVQITGSVKVPGVYSLQQPNETLENLLDRSGSFTDQAYVDGVKLFRNNLQVAMNNFDLALVDGDSIDVPEHTGVVQVLGEVYNTGYVQYVNKRNLNNYIEAAGGFTLDARKKYITVIYPNGDVKVKGTFITPVIKEGSVIIVHTKEEQLPFDMTEFLKETASIIASLATIFYILQI